MAGNFKRNFLIIALLACPVLLLFTGCPHMIEEKIKKDFDFKNYKPVYVTSNIQIDHPDFKDFQMPDSTGRLSIIFDIKNVEHDKYPEFIELKAYLYDTLGRYITGLAPPYFRGTGTYKNYWKTLTEKCAGIDYKIDNYEVTEVRQDSGYPYALSFVLDHSGSMGNDKATKLQKAIKRVMRSIKKGDWVSVIKFDDKNVIEVPITSNQQLYYNQMQVNGDEGLGGGTKIYDAAWESSRELLKAPAEHRKVMILFTDGIDGSSKVTVDSMKRFAKDNNIKVYVISLGLGMSSFDDVRSLAAYTGGKHYHIYHENEFPYVFADIYLTLNNYYLIRYKPPVCASLHNVELNISLPEMKFLELAAHTSYDKSIITADEPIGTVKFINIEFEYDKSDINPGSMPLIEEMSVAMKNNSKIKVNVVGHTDDKGDEDYNLKLSKNRALAVKKALIAMGIDAERIETEGKGESSPLVPNNSEENRTKNRRTEFVLISN
jgi:outer membrane protein OmpA-like peptidoglycan-associated protein/uncharacterized protein YegL